MNARQLALQALLRAHDHDTFVQDELHALIEIGSLSAVDRHLATEIALGTTRQCRTLDFLLNRFLRTPVRTLPLPAQMILRCAAYQILFLDRVPDYAAVNEAVRLMNDRGQVRLAPVANAVLRKLPTLLDVSPGAGSVDDPRRWIPSPHGRWLHLAEPLLPEDTVQRIGIAASFPDALVRRWIRRWGDVSAEQMLIQLNRPPRLFGRINTLKTTSQAIRDRLPDDLRKQVTEVRRNALDLTALPRETLMALLDDGLVTIEDPTAMRAVEALDVRPGHTVLDLCAAPGGKTSYIAELLKGQGHVWAVDRAGPRLERLRETVARLHLAGVHVVANASHGGSDEMPSAFDRVLVDVPCSNTGVLNRRADARWRLTEGLPESLLAMQFELLCQAASATSVGGRCVYSTCSLETDENVAVIRRLLATRGDMVLQAECETLPSDQGDGGYFAVLSRIEPA
jgi:16S rRNA (cytosine967-C5)-methyltransferase